MNTNDLGKFLLYSVKHDLFFQFVRTVVNINKERYIKTQAQNTDTNRLYQHFCSIDLKVHLNMRFSRQRVNSNSIEVLSQYY